MPTNTGAILLFRALRVQQHGAQSLLFDMVLNFMVWYELYVWYVIIDWCRSAHYYSSHDDVILVMSSKQNIFASFGLFSII